MTTQYNKHSTTGYSDSRGSASGTQSGVIAGLGMGFEFTGAVIGMAAVGYGVDYLTGGGTTWTLVGVSVGIIGGFYNLFKAAQRLNARSQARQRAVRTAGEPTSDASETGVGETLGASGGGISRAEPWAGRNASVSKRVDLFSSEEIDGSDVDIEFPPDDDGELDFPQQTDV